MYKHIASKKLRLILAINTFRKSAKKLSKVYWTGFRYWKADDSYNYSLVLGTFRIIFSKIRKHYTTCSTSDYENTIIKSVYSDAEISFDRAGRYFEVSVLDGNKIYQETYSTFDEGRKAYHLIKEKFERNENYKK